MTEHQEKTLAPVGFFAGMPESLRRGLRQLASLLGTIPETLSRILTRMKEYGIIDVNGNHIRLLDFPRLISLSQGDKLG